MDENGILYFVDVKAYFKFVHPWSRNLALDQLVENCFEENGILSNPDNIYYLTSKLSESDADYVTEFITNTTDEILNRKTEYLSIIQPVLDYIDKYVNPEIDKYISNHPSRHRIKEGISEKPIEKLSPQTIFLFFLFF